MKNPSQTNPKSQSLASGQGIHAAENPLDTPFLDGHERKPIERRGPPELQQQSFSHWLSVDQIRRMQRMRRQTVVDAMNDGLLPFEQRGRIRYARLSDVLAWEEHRLSHNSSLTTFQLDPDLEDLAR